MQNIENCSKKVKNVGHSDENIIEEKLMYIKGYNQAIKDCLVVLKENTGIWADIVCYQKICCLVKDEKE